MPEPDAAKQPLQSQLVERIAQSQLPTDERLPEDTLEEIAAFLLAAAELRQVGEAAVKIASMGQGRRFVRIAVVNDDMPFLVNSITAAMAAQGLTVELLLHPIVPVKRNQDGRLDMLASSRKEEGAVAESMIYFEIARIDAGQRRDVERTLEITLRDVRAAVADWRRMADAMAADAERASDPEGMALLRWLSGGMLTHLGHVTRHRDGHHSDLLGVCRESSGQILADASYERAFAWFDAKGANAPDHAPLIVKANRISKVHRPVPMDLFIVPLMEDDRVAALSVHAGIWTSAALNTPPDEVPRMRRHFAALSDKLGFDPGGHTGKALLHSLTVLPHDLLIGLESENVARVAIKMSNLTDRPRPRLTLVEAPLARHLFAFVWLPRDLVSTQTRLRIQALLEEEAGAKTLDWSLQVEGGALALLQFVLDIRASQGVPEEAVVDVRLQAMLRGWTEAVENALTEVEEPVRAAAIATRYAQAFPMEYRVNYGPAEAAVDIMRLRHLGGNETEPDGPTRDARLYRLESDEPERLRLKIYQHAGQLPLSDTVPALENFGFKVLAEIRTALEEGRMGTIHDFVLCLDAGATAAPMLARAQAIESAVATVLNNQSENDLFNRLVTTVGLEEAEVDWLRAIYRYLRQTGLAFTVRTVVNALACAPDITRALIALFYARHDPDGSSSEETAEKSREAIDAGLTGVTAINDDRLLRLYYAVMEAILRTNAFAPAAKEALALKIDSAAIPGLPLPLPWREIFVYSPRVEGVHLRTGPVARGGLRWSDRRDDFRTEVLGLMKSQRVKNAVIVPSGAKGGFYPKQLPDPARDRDGWAAEGRASYEIFIRSLLSITDNIVDGQVVHPRSVVARDGYDPYFVVAADKGTARFSDLANDLAEEQNFWLGDAFASGGSKGYDHKAMGITARGAWISVQRHFREMDIDVQSQPINVIGCGDMSGDVFGNGMLLSKAIKLIAAFDHRHIFIDPDPDPAAAWKERKRLFELPRSSWEDYDPKLISEGGGVWPRTAKHIPLSSRVRELLGIEAEELDPDKLISAILAAPVDLLWFGGIGTYVKARSENHIAVGDPANDTLRVDAAQLRVKVIGEGANLAVTQAGRIEFALAGGRINADFIDNSAGVASSDAEVNIKIALAAACRAGALTEDERIALLEDMTDQVAHLVLEDNRLQTLVLSVAERGGTNSAAAQIRLIELLEETGSLDRRTEGLADEEALARRAIEGNGLTRPELALLLSNTKLVLQDAIEQSTLPDDPRLAEVLFDAFPEKMRARYAPYIEEHRLRQEIIATKLANRIVNRLGIVHPFELAEVEGATLAQVATVFVVADRLFELDALWRRIEDREMSESARLLLLGRLSGVVRNHMADLLRVGVGRVELNGLQDRLRDNVAELARNTSELLEPEACAHSENLRAGLIEEGVPEEEADAVTHLYQLDGAVGVAQLAADADIDPRRLARIFTRIGAKLGLDWAQGSAATMSPSDPWERLLISGLSRDLQQVRLDFLRRLSCGEGVNCELGKALEQWAHRHESEIRLFRAMIMRARSSAPVTPIVLAQIANQARNLFAV